MNLKDIRTKLVQISGRYDLVVDSTGWVDNGANFYINAGLKLIDRLVDTYKSYSRYYATIASGDYYVVIPNCRSVLKIWVSDDEERWELEKVDPTAFREYFYQPMSLEDSGEPTTFSIGYLRTQPEETTQITIDMFGTVEEAVTSGSPVHYTYNCVLFGPPADGDYTLEVQGLFWTPAMSSDTDVNFWTEVMPMAVLYAALYNIEVSYRNREGAADWLSALNLELSSLEKDQIEERVSHISEMRG
jgi:hypothetical protein